MTKTPEELTEDWKAGKLHKRFDEPKLFYCKTDNGIEILKTWGYKNLEFLSMADEVFEPVDDVQILAPVPTYDEYKAMQAELAELKEKIKKREELIQCLGSNIDELDVKKSVLIIENNKLRGLLKECLAHLSLGEIGTSVTPLNILLTRINAALGESEER
jgi:hypothetical protein